MKRCFGIEMKNVMEVQIDNMEAFFRGIYTGVSICAEHERLMIVETEEEQEQLSDYLQSYACFEEKFSLLYLEKGEQKELFSDYGFVAEGCDLFLYEELVASFHIKTGEHEQISMALLQIEEDLVAVEYSKNPIYIIDKQKVTLIKKYAEAYEITVEFLE